MPHRRPLLAAALLLLTLGVPYLPDVGHGFLRNEFAWIRASRLSGLGDLPRLFATDNGFYRPLVNLSFALNHAVFGLSPLGYGLTNLLLMLAAAAALFGLTRASGLPPGTALLATALWALNPHSIPMAVLWISGRTSLLLTLFCLLAARSVVKDQRPAAAPSGAWQRFCPRRRRSCCPPSSSCGLVSPPRRAWASAGAKPWSAAGPCC